MKPIKFDLPLNGQRIANLEQLKENLTPEILEHFRSGKLTKWLRVRSLNEQAEAVDALMTKDNEHEMLLLKSLYELFANIIDDNNTREIIEKHKESKYATQEYTELQLVSLPIYNYSGGNVLSFKNTDNGIIKACAVCHSSVLSIYYHYSALTLTDEDVGRLNKWIRKVSEFHINEKFIYNLILSLDFSSDLPDSIKNIIKQTIDEIFFKYVVLCAEDIKTLMLIDLNLEILANLSENHIHIFSQFDRLLRIASANNSDDIAKVYKSMGYYLKNEILNKFNTVLKNTKPLNVMYRENYIEANTVAHMGWIKSINKMIYVDCDVRIDPNNNEITVDKNNNTQLTNDDLVNFIHTAFNNLELHSETAENEFGGHVNDGFSINLVTLSGQVFTVYNSYKTLGYWYTEPKTYNIV